MCDVHLATSKEDLEDAAKLMERISEAAPVLNTLPSLDKLEEVAGMLDDLPSNDASRYGGYAGKGSCWERCL
jgi:hypothetical protein